MGITISNPAPARLLDLTRLTRRAGRPFTGVDRVEKAYLDCLLTQNTPVFGLVKSAFGYILLDQAGCAALRLKLETGNFGPADRLSSVKRGLDPMRARAESDLRRICLDRCLPIRLSRMLRRHLPPGVHYLNVGHSNLTERVLSSLRLIRGSKTGVLIHDTIPLDHPQYQRPETARSFKVLLQTAARHADLIICNSAQTKADVLRHAAPLTPETVVAHLGVPAPVLGTPPKGPWEGHPYFVCLGTIEPRKNHALLLDLWQDVPDAHLLICGNRGWENDAVFDRLDAKPPGVHELSGLDDGQVFGLLAQSKGLLFPSLSEGYGLPPIEAAALGVPVLCNDLPIYREVLGNIPVYAPVSERYLWLQEIKGLASSDRAHHGTAECDGQGWRPPTWDAHFKTVLTLI